MDDQSRQLRLSFSSSLRNRFTWYEVPESYFQLATEVALKQYMGGTLFEECLVIGSDIIETAIEQWEGKQ